MNKWTVIYEINCEYVDNEDPSEINFATIWIMPGIQKADSLGGVENYGYVEGAIKFVGPIRMKEAKMIYRALIDFLVKTSDEVYYFDAADD